MIRDISHFIKTEGWEIGQKIDLDFEMKNSYGKCLKRNIMDDLVSYCMLLPIHNLHNAVDNQRFFFEEEHWKKDDLKLLKEFVKGKRHALPRIIDEKRGWIRRISEIIDRFEYAVITGIKVRPHHLSKICPSNIAYAERHNLVKYNVMVVGMCEKNECAFETELLDYWFKKF